MFRGKRIIGWWIDILMAAFILMSFAQAPSEAAVVVPDNQEMKLLLKTDLFVDRDQGYQEYWGIIKNLAGEMGVGVTESDHAFKEGEKKVVYYDTKNMDLTKKNYILRQRINIMNEQIAAKCDLTLKYRTTGVDGVPSDAVVTAANYKPTISFQEDFAGFCDGVVGNNRGEMSLSHTLKKIPLTERNTLADYATYFPTLDNLGINPNEPLYLIHGVSVKEYKVSPGVLDFGGFKGEVDFSVWFNYDTDEPIIAEMSWECDKDPADAAAKAQAFFNALQERSKDLLYPGQMKVKFVFDYNH